MRKSKTQQKQFYYKEGINLVTGFFSVDPNIKLTLTGVVFSQVFRLRMLQC